MGLLNTVSVLKDLLFLQRVKKAFVALPAERKDSVLNLFEDIVEQFGDRPALRFEDRTLTWDELNQKANQYARVLRAADVKTGDVVSLFMENRIEFLVSLIGILKAGATGGLINTNLVQEPLRHCINVTNSKVCIFGSELAEATAGVRELVGLEDSAFMVVPDGEDNHGSEWASNLELASHNQSTENLPETKDITLGMPALYIFTSGTTGLPKAAIMSHRRLMQAAKAAGTAGLRANHTHSIYLSLPLYHATGLTMGVGGSLTTGATMVLRRRFSASSLLGEVRKYGATHMIYVGELCRYLMNTPVQPDDHDSPLETLMGNGLRPDIWLEFKKRFGIKRITEIYGASEGNVVFVNLLNKDKTIGMTTNPVALVNYDVVRDEIIKDADGHCTRVEEGEPGLCVCQINELAVFEGYTDKEATEKKILRNVFEDGDAWFNTGDLLRTIDVGFSVGLKHYQFVDRVGDTFRWRSENVSTNEVAEILNSYSQFEICNVYGVDVPGTEGRAGMVAVSLAENEEALNLEDLSRFVEEQLPHFARPVFVRVQTDLNTTGTLKLVKKDLQEENYDLTRTSDPIYVMRPRSNKYEPLDSELLSEIQAGTAGY